MRHNLEKIIVGNAAGTVKTVGDVESLRRSAVTRITVGSITKLQRDGNTGDVYYFDPKTRTSVNALGMPNMGIENYRRTLHTMVDIAHRNEKQLWVSVAGLGSDEFPELAAACIACGVDGVELNLGCPNVHDRGEHKQPFSYDPERVEYILRKLRQLTIKSLKDWPPIGVKISPVPPDILDRLAITIAESGIVAEVVAVNTIPGQQMQKEDGSQALAFCPPESSQKKHVGGKAGAPLLKEGLRTVTHLRERLPTNIRIIGCGGVFTGTDALVYLDAGAQGFECATGYLGEGQPNARIFSDILTELVELMEARVA